MGDQPIMRAKFHGLIAAPKALADQIASLITTTTG